MSQIADIQGESERIRRKRRLRRWESKKMGENGNRNMAFAKSEIERVCKALELPPFVEGRAKDLYEEAFESNAIRGHSIESISLGVIYVAAREADHVRSMDELESVSRVNEADIRSAFRRLRQELNVRLPPGDPLDYLGRFVDRMNSPRDEPISEETVSLAQELCEIGVETGMASGKNPNTYVATSLYVAGKETGEDLTQRELASVENMSEVTIRKHYGDLALEAADRGLVDIDNFPRIDG